MASGSQKKNLKTSGRKKNSHSGKNTRRAQAPVRKGKSAKAKTQKNEKEMSPITMELIFCIILAVSVLMILGNFHIAGRIGNFFAYVLFGIFGWMEYLFPILFLFGFTFFLVNRRNTLAIRKVVGLVLVLAALCTLLELFTGVKTEKNVLAGFKNAARLHRGGGILGSAIAKVFSLAFGTVGAYILAFAFLCISLILLTQRPILSDLGRKGRRAAREAHERHLQRAAESAEESPAKTADAEMKADSSLTGILSHNKKKEEKAKDTANDSLTNRPFDQDREAFESLDLSGLHINGRVPSEGALQGESDSEMASAAADDPVEKKEEQKKKQRTEAEQRVRQSPEEKAADIMKIQLEVNDREQKPQLSYRLPGLDLLTGGTRSSQESEKQLMETAAKLQTTLENFGVNVHVVNISQGPTVTRYELQPEQGVKVSRIVNLQDDIKLNLAASEIRIEAPIPGKAAVGIEVPNRHPSTVMLRDLLQTEEFRKSKAKLAFAVGKDLAGRPVIADIEKMPHLLIAGATGSGKSVCINTLIVSLLYKYRPDEVRFLMIDPKVVELKIYDGIPHLLIPVVTDAKKAAGALNWAVQEMTQRYQKFASHPGIRDIKGYNKFVDEHNRTRKDEAPLERMPRIVVIVDELADLMMAASNEVEDAICRLAQLARAAGIHLVIATQRPSVNVVTGLIKANMPSRIALAVTSGVDSRTILDMNGAEKLLGKGDMLFYPQGYPKPARVQGSFVSDEDITRVVGFLTSQGQEVEYNKDIERKIEENASAQTVSSGHSEEDDHDEYFADAGRLIIEKDKASIGMLQRAFKIGFNRAARIMDQLCDAGVVGEEEGTKPRKILMSMEEYEQMLQNLSA